MNTEQARSKRLQWWREARFGMFIHWGLYALPAGEWKGRSYPGIGEWIMFKARISIDEYEKLAGEFNPVAFDADAWAQLAQDAGMKYLIITAKHHDGFAMFSSKASRFNIVDATPYSRDPLKDLAEACARRDIRFGVYYSQAQDWHAPGGAIWDIPHEGVPVWEKLRWDARQEGDFDMYLQTVAEPQIRELLTNYGPIGVIWFDTPLKVMTPERAGRLEKIVRELQPDTLISGRLGGEHQSDYDSEGDNVIPEAGRSGDWETPATLNDTWGFRKDDENWKSADELVFNLVDIVSKGGNYLLNVGPDAKGVIPQASQDALREVGRWMKVNGESIYGSGATAFGSEFEDGDDKNDGGTAGKWRCTSKPGCIYIHLFAWPERELILPEIRSGVVKAEILGYPELPVSIDQADDRLILGLPEMPGRSPAFVVRLSLR